MGRSARPVKQFTRESSGDDLSVRSDVSRGELRERLKGERKSKNEQEGVLKHLQDNYSDLLMKFADAENTIDKLRIGATIDLDVNLPEVKEDLDPHLYQADIKENNNNQDTYTQPTT